jgi:hypothetical protein
MPKILTISVTDSFLLANCHFVVGKMSFVFGWSLDLPLILMSYSFTTMCPGVLFLIFLRIWN